MTVGLAPAIAQALLDALLNGVSYVNSVGVFVQLHIGDPGVAGTTNVATNNTRKSASFGAAGANGVCSNDAEILWSSVPAAEDYTHASVWTLVSGGTFLGSGAITSNAVGVGDDFRLAIGDLDVSLNVAA